MRNNILFDKKVSNSYYKFLPIQKPGVIYYQSHDEKISEIKMTCKV